MFEFKKIVTYFLLLPPGSLITFLVVLSLILRWKGHKNLWQWTLSVAALLYLLSIEPVASLLITPLEERYKVPTIGERNRCEALVVLGGGVIVGAPFIDTKNDLSEDAFKRAIGAYKLYLERERPIIFSGYSVRDQISEASVAASLLESLGVDRGYIYKEEKSKDTAQNALYTKRLIDKLGINKFCLITSAYHMPRAVFLFERAGFNKTSIIPVPVDFKASHAPFSFYQLLPTAYWLDVSSKALKEYFGLIYYYLFRKN